jgi:putative intracellular protease/amidase
MFKALYEFLDTGESNDMISTFFSNIEAFAFYEELKASLDVFDIESVTGKQKIVSALLEDKLSYGNLPKALLKMHLYDSDSLTPIDEHLYEAEAYLPEDKYLHFTISEAHERFFNDYIKKAADESFNISYSFQKKKTDTLAVDLNNEPFKLEDGTVLYRAGGHGALIENLNDIDADIIFIKNIDNVCHRDHVNETVESKKKLAAIGYEIKKTSDELLLGLIEGAVDLKTVETFITSTLKIIIKEELTREMALKILNRPFRVCGVVRNQGDPGGGPFLVDNGDYVDLQICETAELDLKDASKKAILDGAQYFNPVDLVCFVKDYKGFKYNLLDFINEDRYFISEKSLKGKQLKALEHPGLWNGAMHHWNTIFVEVPLITFNPVKTVNDLLKKGHKAK